MREQWLGEKGTNEELKGFRDCMDKENMAQGKVKSCLALHLSNQKNKDVTNKTLGRKKVDTAGKIILF